MTEDSIHAFENLRKNAHIWLGERSLVWYSEELNDSFSILALCGSDDSKRRIAIKFDGNTGKVECTNDEVSPEHFLELTAEIEALKDTFQDKL